MIKLKIAMLKQMALPFAVCACAILLSGCNTSQNTGALGSFFGQLAGQTTGGNSQAYGLAAQSTQDIAAHQQQDEAASQAAIGNGAYEFEDGQFGYIAIVTCGGQTDSAYGDLGKRQRFSLDYYGIKTTFNTREQFQICTASCLGTGWGYKIFNENGFVVHYGTLQSEGHGIVVKIGPGGDYELPSGNYVNASSPD